MYKMDFMTLLKIKKELTNLKVTILKYVLSIFLVIFISYPAEAQYASKKVKSKYQIYTDSIKQVKYDYIFPVLGQGAYKKGFDIPYPIGVMANALWMKQGITIDNMQLGLKTENNDIPLTPIDFIGFGENSNTSYTVNIRPDIWILPFLNVYGLFGYGNSSTEVNVVKPININSVVDQGIRTMGFGLMGAGGVGPIWWSVDANFTWNKPELLEKPTKVSVLGIRMGHTFVFKNNPERNIAIWIGTMRMHMGTETVGSIKLGDALPPETWERRDEIVNEYWDWYDNEATIPQKIAADKVLTPIIDRLENADGDAVISYAMDKQTKQLWNGTIGMQFQLNKRWMFRTEGGIIGDRKSALLSANYRFLL